jgi:hypothetical protein
MNIKRSITTATAVLVATAGVASAPAMAFQSAGTLSNGAPQPTHKMTHAAWKHCWSTVYANWRADGFTPQSSQTAADWTCGTQP